MILPEHCQNRTKQRECWCKVPKKENVCNSAFLCWKYFILIFIDKSCHTVYLPYNCSKKIYLIELWWKTSSAISDPFFLYISNLLTAYPRDPLMAESWGWTVHEYLPEWPPHGRKVRLAVHEYIHELSPHSRKLRVGSPWALTWVITSWERAGLNSPWVPTWVTPSGTKVRLNSPKHLPELPTHDWELRLGSPSALTSMTPSWQKSRKRKSIKTYPSDGRKVRINLWEKSGQGSP